MNRRSFLSFLGLAPVAAAAAAPVDYGMLVVDTRDRIAKAFELDDETLTLPGIEIRTRVEADTDLAKRIDSVVEQVNAGAFDAVLRKRYGLKAI